MTTEEELKALDVVMQKVLKGLKADRDWWRQSALNTEKLRARTSNMLEKNNATCCRVIEGQGRTIHYLRKEIDGRKAAIEDLEAELSVRKQDSDVLIRIIEVVKDVSIGGSQTIYKLDDILNNYFDVQGSDDQNIDEVPTIIVACCYREEAENYVLEKVYPGANLKEE